MKRHLLTIVMLFAISAYAQSVTKNDCSTCVGANNFVEAHDKPLMDTRDAALIKKEAELNLINSEITTTILELRKLNVITLPKYESTGDDNADKKSYLEELKKLLPAKTENK